MKTLRDANEFETSEAFHPFQRSTLDVFIDTPIKVANGFNESELTKNTVMDDEAKYNHKRTSFLALGFSAAESQTKQNLSISETTLNQKNESDNKQDRNINTGNTDQLLTEASLFELITLTCFNFPYGFICGTFGLWLLPAEANRLFLDTQSVVLGLSLGIVGLTQLVCPVIGKISDKYRSRSQFGKRKPYILSGCVLAIGATVGMFAASKYYAGISYYFCLFLGMIGLNITYAVQCGLVPDVLDESLRGCSSGLVAVHTLLGSSAGFALIIGTSKRDFHLVYVLYIILTAISCILMCHTAHKLEVRRTLINQYYQLSHDSFGKLREQKKMVGDRCTFDNRKDIEVASLLNTASRTLTPQVFKNDWNETSHEKFSEIEAEEINSLNLKYTEENYNNVFCNFRRSSSLEPRTIEKASVSSEEGYKFTMSDLKNAFIIDTSESYDFFWVFIGRTLYYVGVSVQAFMLYYLRDVLGIPSEAQRQKLLGCIALIAQTVAALIAYPIGVYTDKHPEVAKKTMISVACGIMASVYLGFLLAPLFKLYAVHFVVIMALIYGTGNGCFLAVDYALALATLPSKEDTTHALGIWGVSAFIGSSLGPLLWGSAIEAFGKDPNTGLYRFSGYVAIMLGGLASTFLAGATIRLVKVAV